MKYLELITEPKQPQKILFVDFADAKIRVSEAKLLELLSKTGSNTESEDLNSLRELIKKEFEIGDSGTETRELVKETNGMKVIGFKSDTGLFGVMI
jgi:hypothetical protein